MDLPARVEPLRALALQDEPKILIGICSSHRYPERRKAVRETWLRNLPAEIVALFFVGEGGPCDETGVIALPAPDDYERLSNKVFAFYRFVLGNYQFDYLFKCDDDTYVHADRLRNLPRPGVDFLGSMELKFQGFASGGAGYLMSRQMVEKLVREPVVAPLNEDVLFSQRAMASGMRCESTESLRGFGDQWPEPGNEIVTAHWCGGFEMQRIHAGLTGEYPGPLLVVFHARHTAWSGSLRLYADGSFWSKGGAAPNGVWSVAESGEFLVLRWYHWPAESLALRSWGFEAPNFRLEFADAGGPERWHQISRMAIERVTCKREI